MKVIERLKPYSLPILAGFFHGTSYVPFPPWALFFCLVPLWLFWIQAPAKKLFWGTSLCFFIGTLIGFHWIAYTAHEFGHLPWAVSLLVLLLFCIFANIHFALAGLVWKFLTYKTRGHFKLILLPLVTACFAYFFPTLFPWNYGHPWLFGHLPGVQLADVVGIDGISTLTIGLNFLIFMAFYKKNYQVWLGAFLLAFASINTLGFFHQFNISQTSHSINVLFVQANIGNLEKQYALHQNRYREVVVNKFLNMTETALDKSVVKPDMIIWPETAYPSYVDKDNFSVQNAELYDMAQRYSASFITGFYDYTPGYDRPSNAMLYVSREGHLTDAPTHKSILLAFGEYLPGAEWFPWLKKLAPMVSDFQQGPGPEVRKLDEYVIGPLICYEALFPNFARKLALDGADFFVNLTNDSWYGKTFEPWQHLYIAAGRAIENRIPLLRSTNTGYTTAVLETGEVLELSTLGSEWAEVLKVPYHKDRKPTAFQVWGWYAHWILLLFTTFVFVVYGWLKYYYERT
ncbi:MAG: apolipoprotein N-acyltransferase [Bdellovibrionaceae bacterium]|nr:apolipoprotein N-acyltransferase [Pseudobdellovibrionaceae bacterium]